MKKIVPALLASAILIGLIGCATTEGRTRPDATEYQRTVSSAISQSEKTQLGDQLKEAVSANPGKSGFRVLERGSTSLIARLAIVRMAQKTVDLQYYAIGHDVTSNLMIEALLQAAERGVRVRLLIDSFTIGDMEENLALLNGIKNIEIRVFNPLTTKDQPLLSRFASMFTDLPQANRRMHNKALIGDNQMAIMGGRNLSSEYFNASADLDFKDIDILTAGPITAELSKSFDAFWNNENSFPIDTVHEVEVDRRKIAKLRGEVEQTWNSTLQDPARKRQISISISDLMKDPEINLIWARGAIAADDPHKISAPVSYEESEPLDQLLNVVDRAKNEFVIVSAYFVPKEEGVAWLKSLEQKGVHVRILTNSLASTDVVAVHSGYEPYRKDLIKSGVELYELMPVDEKRPRQRFLGRSQPPRAGLHTKAYIIDRRYTSIGSLNLDPRSVELNTEVLLVIDSPEIAARMMRMFERTIDPAVSYTLTVDPETDRLTWHSREKGQSLKYDRDPRAGFWRSIQTSIFSILPLEDHL